MALKIGEAEEEMLLSAPKLIVIGVGGAGCNAVNSMIEDGLTGVEFIAANTDAQSLKNSRAEVRIQLGRDTTKGYGSGMVPEIGEAAAQESIAEILEHTRGADMVFISAGMGGGTGTGAAPVIARELRKAGILTVGVVTKPFNFEGFKRATTAEVGLVELAAHTDTMIVIANQNLFKIASPDTTYDEAFKMADNVLYHAVASVTDLITRPGLINMDFADVRTVMKGMGRAMIGCGERDGDDRAIRAAEAALSNPLLDNDSMIGAQGVLVNISGGKDMKLVEVDAAANRIRAEVDDNANIRFGSCLDESLEGRIRISIVAAGMSDDAPPPRDRYSEIGARAESYPRVRESMVSMPEAKEEPVAQAPAEEETKEEKSAFSWNSFFSRNKDEAAAPKSPEVESETKVRSTFRFVSAENEAEAKAAAEYEEEFVVNSPAPEKVAEPEPAAPAQDAPSPNLSASKPFMDDMFSSLKNKLEEEDKSGAQTDLEDILEIPTFLRRK